MKKNVPFLRLVGSGVSDAEDLPQKVPYHPYWQPTLFPEMDNVVIALDLDTAGSNCFFHTLREVRPHFVIDLRIVPRFDYSGLNRRVAFELFRMSGATYLDVAGDLGVTDQRDSKMNPAFIAHYLKGRISRSSRIVGPITFLVEHEPQQDAYIPLLMQHVAGDQAWQLLDAPTH